MSINKPAYPASCTNCGGRPYGMQFHFFDEGQNETERYARLFWIYQCDCLPKAGERKKRQNEAIQAWNDINIKSGDSVSV